MSKSPSQMNKKELYELCKKLQEDNKTHQMNINDLEEQIDDLKSDRVALQISDKKIEDLKKEIVDLEKIKASCDKYINIVENHSANIHNDHICRKDSMDKSKFNSIDKDRLKKMIEVDSRENCAMWNYAPYLKLLLEQTELKEKYGREADDFEEENKKLKEEIKTLKESNASYEDLLGGDDGTIDKIKQLEKENKELINIIKSTKEFLEECCDKNDNGIYNHYETRQIATRIIDKNVGESYEEEISDLKEEIEDLEKDIKTWKKDYDKLIKEHLKENANLKKQLYVVDHETGEISDRTILQSYETPKFKEWRRENRNSRIQAEGSDDVSDLDLGKYIKTLETDTDWIKDLVFDNLCDICNPHDVCDADELTDDMIELIIQDIHSRFMDIRSLC